MINQNILNEISSRVKREILDSYPLTEGEFGHLKDVANRAKNLPEIKVRCVKIVHEVCQKYSIVRDIEVNAEIEAEISGVIMDYLDT